MKELEKYFARIGEMPPWNMTANTYDTSQQVDVVNGCYAFMFTNLGDVIATVNGLIILPGTPGVLLGDSRTVSGQLLSLYKGNITLAFANPPIGVAPLVEIAQFFLLNPDDYNKK